jgi:hypothetical protein
MPTWKLFLIMLLGFPVGSLLVYLIARLVFTAYFRTRKEFDAAPPTPKE